MIREASLRQSEISDIQADLGRFRDEIYATHLTFHLSPEGAQSATKNVQVRSQLTRTLCANKTFRISKKIWTPGEIVSKLDSMRLTSYALKERPLCLLSSLLLCARSAISWLETTTTYSALWKESIKGTKFV